MNQKNRSGRIDPGRCVNAPTESQTQPLNAEASRVLNGYTKHEAIARELHKPLKQKSETREPYLPKRGVGGIFPNEHSESVISN